MFWDLLDIILNFFNLFSGGKIPEEANKHFKNLK